MKRVQKFHRKSIGILMLALICCWTLTGCSVKETVSALWSQVLTLTGISSQQTEETLDENQREIYGQVVSAVGNEITLQLGTLQTQPNQEQPDDGADPSALPENGTAEQGNASRQGSEGFGAMPAQGEGMPADAAMFESDNGGGRTTTENIDATASFDPAQGKTEANFPSQMRVGVTLELTGEEVVYQIPPSVPVEYSMGDQTLTLSFSRISAENTLRLVLQTLEDGSEAVVKVQILG